MKSTFHDLRITQLGSTSAWACLGLAERVFGKDSPQFQAVRDFTKEKRAGYVATIRGVVVGFIVYDNRGRETAQVLSLAVHKPDRRRGIGSRLLERIIRLPRKEIVVKVDERNLDAQLFLRSQGVRAVEIKPGTPECYIFKRSKVSVASTASEVNNEIHTVGAKQR